MSNVLESYDCTVLSENLIVYARHCNKYHCVGESISIIKKLYNIIFCTTGILKKSMTSS